MTLAEFVLALMWGGVTAYAVFAGADFGAGFWDLTAGDATRGRPRRELIAHSIAPVWEANHVWLIYVLVVLWTGFPRVFAAIMSTLYIPLTAAAAGVIMRGSAFAFRKAATDVALERAFGATFAASSVITPFFLGTVAGGVATTRVPFGNATGDAISSWFNPTSVFGGVLAVVTCAFLAAVFLCVDASHRAPDLVDGFRRRAIAAGALCGVLAIAGVAIVHADAPDLYHGLTHRGLPLVIASAVAGVATLLLLRARRFVIARATAAVAVVAIVWGWAAGQYPYMLEGSV
ncbi:MAG: cytochrome bd ubiquinol oxidase subunit, partial [Actinomycetota bacterium]